jgi:cytochrome c oxidase subunit III
MDIKIEKIKEESLEPIEGDFTYSMHPQKFGLWLFIGSVVMLFAAFTSAYIVRKSDGNWLEFDLPVTFWWTSVIVILSSITMQYAYWSASKDELRRTQISLLLTGILGIAFLVGQFIGWREMVQSGVFFTGDKSNPSGSFIYVLTGVHGLHIVSALVVLFLITIYAFQYKVHAKNLLRIEMCTTYWHFLGILWLYLFGFLFLSHHQYI